MNIRRVKQPLRSSYAVIAIGACVLVPHVAWCQPNGLGTVGVIEITTPAAPAPCELRDTQLEQSRKHVDDSQAASDAARARLVRAHLRTLQYPTALLDFALDEEELESQRAELHAAQREVAQAEDQLWAAGCDTVAAENTRIEGHPVVEVAVRMELPPRYLQPLKNALRTGSASVVAYPDVNGTTLRGELISVESVMTTGEPILAVRAHLHDPRHQLRDGELLGVEVRLSAPL